MPYNKAVILRVLALSFSFPYRSLVALWGSLLLVVTNG